MRFQFHFHSHTEHSSSPSSIVYFLATISFLGFSSHLASYYDTVASPRVQERMGHSSKKIGLILVTRLRGRVLWGVISRNGKIVLEHGGVLGSTMTVVPLFVGDADHDTISRRRKIGTHSAGSVHHRLLRHPLVLTVSVPVVEADTMKTRQAQSG